MNETQKAAFITSQSTAAVIQAMSMVAENQFYTGEGHLPKYGEGAFMALIERYGIGHNTVLETFGQ